MAIIDRRGVVVDATDTIIAAGPNPGLAIKAPCHVATTGSITLAGLQTIDGVALADGDRVLVWMQADGRTNGIYNASAGLWQRSLDADSNDQWADGFLVVVTDGSRYARTLFQCITEDPIILGTSDVEFATPSLTAIEFVIDGGGAQIAPAADLDLEIPFQATLLRWSLMADRVGSIVVDVWKAPFASFPPTIANSVTGSSQPTLSSAQSAQSSDLTGWTTAIDVGDVLRCAVISATTVQRVTLSLLCSRVP